MTESPGVAPESETLNSKNPSILGIPISVITHSIDAKADRQVKACPGVESSHPITGRFSKSARLYDPDIIVNDGDREFMNR